MFSVFSEEMLFGCVFFYFNNLKFIRMWYYCVKLLFSILKIKERHYNLTYFEPMFPLWRN